MKKYIPLCIAALFIISSCSEDKDANLESSSAAVLKNTGEVVEQRILIPKQNNLYLDQEEKRNSTINLDASSCQEIFENCNLSCAKQKDRNVLFEIRECAKKCTKRLKGCK